MLQYHDRLLIPKLFMPSVLSIPFPSFPSIECFRALCWFMTWKKILRNNKGSTISLFAKNVFLIDWEFLCQTCLGIEEDTTDSSRLLVSSLFRLLSLKASTSSSSDQLDPFQKETFIFLWLRLQNQLQVLLMKNCFV